MEERGRVREQTQNSIKIGLGEAESGGVHNGVKTLKGKKTREEREKIKAFTSNGMFTSLLVNGMTGRIVIKRLFNHLMPISRFAIHLCSSFSFAVPVFRPCKAGLDMTRSIVIVQQWKTDQKLESK
jgi:hypothetical protein